MITSQGMRTNDVRCTVCGHTAWVGASQSPGLPCVNRRDFRSPRCPGVYRTKAEIEAMARAASSTENNE